MRGIAPSRQGSFSIEFDAAGAISTKLAAAPNDKGIGSMSDEEKLCREGTLATPEAGQSYFSKFDQTNY